LTFSFGCFNILLSMTFDLASLKEFLDLGGTFILALVLLYSNLRKLDVIESQNVKILTLLSIMVKTQTNFNGVDKVLGKDGEKVAKTIIEAEAE